MSFSYQGKKRCSVCEVHFVIANMKYLGAQSGMGFLIIKAWRIQFSCILFVYNNPIPSVSIRRWNTTNMFSYMTQNKSRIFLPNKAS